MPQQRRYDALVESLASPVERSAAHRALAMAGAAANGALVRGLSHADPQVRQWCASLLDHHAGTASLPAIVAALEDRVADVRRLAVHSIGCQTCKDEPLAIDVVGLLIERVRKDPSVRVRRVAVHMLGNQPPDERARVVLAKLLETETDAKVLRNAEWALGQHEAPV